MEDYLNVDNFFLEYIEDNVDNADENTRSNIISMIYYFWEKNKCNDIDMKNKSLYKMFFEIYEANLSEMKDDYIFGIVDLNNNEFMDICDILGIDTSEMREINAEWNLFESEDVWNTWNDFELSSSFGASSIYYRQLIGGNDTFKNQREFCDAFSSGLDKYCEDVLIPEIEKVLNEMGIEY